MKRILLFSIIVLGSGTCLAQVQRDNNVEQSAVQVISTITASATAERVRFTSPNTVVQLRLEVYDEAGQKLLDTEQRGGNVIDWHLQAGTGERVSDGVYLCVLTSKNLSGRLSQKLGQVTVSGQRTAVRSAAATELNLRQTQSVGPLETGEAGLTVMAAEDTPAVTVLANTGDEAQLARTRGALTFRVGDFFSGNDKEQMRLTEDGNLGIGTSAPKSKLDVAGSIRAERFLVVKPKLAAGQTTDSNTLATDSSNVQPLVAGNGTAGKLTKWTDGSGTLGDSVMTESAGNIGIGTASPTQALDVLNGRIVTTGSQTLTATSDSMIEVKSTITNNGLAQSAIKARNLFNGPGDFVTGIDGAPTFAPSTSINTAQGFVAAAFFAPPPGVTITNALGGASATVYSNASGAVTNGTAFNIVSPFVFGALKPLTQYGLHINNQGIAGTNTSYGLFVDAQAGSANNYSAIFAGGNVGIGTTTPGFKLDVVGRMRVKQATNAATNTAGIWFNQIGLGNDQAFVGMVDDTHVGFFGNTGAGWGLTMDTTSGSVGVGTTLPVFPLNVVGSAGSGPDQGVAEFASLGDDTGIRLLNAAAGGRTWTLFSSGGSSGIGAGNFNIYDATSGQPRFTITQAGRVGIGTTIPGAKLDVTADFDDGVSGTSNNNTGVKGSGRFGGFFSGSQFGVVGFTADGVGASGQSTNGAGVTAQTTNGNIYEGYSGGLKFRVTNTGEVRSDVGFTTPAADFAELVAADDPAKLNAGGLDPGDVLVIDPDTGKLRKSSQRYSTLVAGIYSTKPGFLGNQGVTDVTAAQAVPVALIGVVPTKVSAENGAIRPGDLLTTSSLPGYAMKASPILVRGVKVYRTGTVVGKALEPLKQGKGVIKVLVTLR